MTESNQETDSKLIQASEPAINYKVEVPTYVMGDELAIAARGKGHESEELIVDEGDVYKSDKGITTHPFSDNQEEQTDTQVDFQNTLMTESNQETDSKLIQASEPAINYKVEVPTYVMGDELATTARGKGHEREGLTVDEGDVYKSEKGITTHPFSDNQEEQTDTQVDFQNTFMTESNQETDSTLIQASEAAINYKVEVPTYVMGDELASAARGKGHEREELVVDEGDVYESDKGITTHPFSDNQEEQRDTQMDFQNTFMTKETENLENPGILKTGMSKENQEASYLNALHIPNISDFYETTLLETTFQTTVTPLDIMNKTTVTSIPTERSDTPQSSYFKKQDGDGSTDAFHKSLVPKDDPLHLHAHEYDTSPINHPTTTPQDKSFNGEEARSASNLESDFGDAAVDVWNQIDAKEDALAEQRNHSDDTDVYQGHVFTSDISVNEERGLDPLYFIVPTIEPQQNGVTNNYIQLYETKVGESAQQPPETQNNQNKLISSEQSRNEYILPLQMTDHAEIPVLQHLTLGLQKSGSLPTRNISLENIVDMANSLQNTVNSTDVMNKPHQNQGLIEDHNTIQLSDFLQLPLHARNSLTHMQSDDGINSNINKTDYTNVPELQTVIATEHPLMTYSDLNQRHYKETPQAAGLSFNGMKSFEGDAHMGHNMDQQRYTSDSYTPRAELYEDLSVPRHDYFGSYNIQLPKERKESKNIDLQKLESSISGISKQNETEYVSQVANPYPNFEGHDIKFANEGYNDEQDAKFETEDASHVIYGQEKLSPNYNIHNTDSSTLQIQNQYKNAERFHSSLKQTVEPKYTHKNHNEVFETVTQYTAPDSLTGKHRDRNEQECYMYCNNILNGRSKDKEDYMTKEGIRKPTFFPPDDVIGVLPEYIQSRNGMASSMELMQPDDLGEILKSEYTSKIMTESEKPEGETEAGKYYEPDPMRVMTENRQGEGDRTGYKQIEEESEDVTDYQGPKEVTVQDYEWLHDPTTVRRDHKAHENELQVQYATKDHKVLQSGVVTEQAMALQGASKRIRNAQNFYTTNAIRQSGENTRNIINAYKNTLLFLLQNKEKIQSLLDLPYSYAMTSTPAMTTRREDRSQLNKQSIVDHGEVKAMNLALNKIKPANVHYSSVETTGQPNHVIMESIKSNGLSHLESLREKNRKAKSKSDGCKTTGTFNDEYNLRYQETLQQPSRVYIPSVNVHRSEVLYKWNNEPKQKSELKPRIRDSDNTWGTAMNPAHLSSQNSMRPERSNCGPWALYKNYLCMPAASPRPDHHLLHSDDESMNTAPNYSYETNISGEPGYAYVMDSSLESDKMAQDLSQNRQGKHHSRNHNIQRADTLSKKEIVLEKNVIDYNDDENQRLSDDSTIDIYNAFDSPQLFKFYMKNDDRISQPKLYNKRKSNSNHNTVYIPEESYQKLIKNSVVSRIPVSMGNWKNYEGSPEEIIHLKPSAFKKNNYKTHRQHSSDGNTNKESIRSFPLEFKGREMNKLYKYESGEIGYYKSGKEEYEQPSEWEFLNTGNRQSPSFSEEYDQSKEHSQHQDCGEETIIQASPEINLKNANELFDGDIIRMPVNDPSYKTEVFNTYNNNYKKKLPSERMQKLSKNIYKYSHDYRNPITHHKLPVKDDGWQRNDIHQIVTQHLLHQKNDHVLHQSEDNDNSWGDGYETNESDDNSVIRRTRSAMQYTTIGSSEEEDKDLYPQYQSRSCQSYNCEGVLASEVKIVTAILKWLKNIVTDTKKT
jgi:hypothetical protein